MTTRQVPTQGLYDPEFEHDACGIALVADLHGRRAHSLVSQGLEALEHLAHRGATGAEVDTGDGAGILTQVPDRFLRGAVGFDLPDHGGYAPGLVFLPKDPDDAAKAARRIEELASEESLRVLGWREVPIEPSGLGASALGCMPGIRQVFVAPVRAPGELSALELDRLTFCLRKRIEHEVEGTYLPSLSARTLVYKGMLTGHQLRHFYPDLSEGSFESAIALVHSRFSTNTFPSWPLAHPYRYLAHNGEINTLRGNRNWMRAREALLESELLPGELERLFPICEPTASDSACFDEALELLHLGGRSLAHAVLMMIPEAWENHGSMDEARRAFYRYHASLMEPWDGPAAVVFTDGTIAGGVLDRNGLRPARYWVTDEGLVVLASEVWVLDIDPARIVRKGRLAPGRMFLVDTAQGRIVDDGEIKAQLAAEHPYDVWLGNQVELDELPPRMMLTPQHASVVTHQRLFGYTNEELRIILAPMAKMGIEPVGSMGNDAALAVLSDKPRLVYDYFTQLFAQVTNPPLDAIREELVTSNRSKLGPEGNLLEPTEMSCRQIILPCPVIDNDDLAKLRYVNEHGETPGFEAFAIDALFDPAGGGEALALAIEDVRRRVSIAIGLGANVVILSDRNSTERMAPIPSLLITAAVHEHMVREKTRTRVGLVVESGDAREVHHVALLIGFGASAVNPYLALETVNDMIATGLLEGLTPRQAGSKYIKALAKGVIKTMSKMGVSTVASYTGAQIFEAVGLARDVVDEYFAGTTSRIGGVGLDVLADEVAQRHHIAHLGRPTELAHRELEIGGEYQWRREGEVHLFNPKTVFKLQHATRAKRYDIFKEYTRLVDDQSEKLATLRGLLRLREGVLPPVPLEEVEPVSEIVKRFSTGAMSYGSISAEAHETLAIAMNRLGGRSNTGEGGE
ncbi:MAG: glutamate synthase central domain-containing protein, partial [Acidimicrobiales bacterium]